MCQVVRHRNRLEWLGESDCEESDWMPRRLKICAEVCACRDHAVHGCWHHVVLSEQASCMQDIKLVHFSGELKYWHMMHRSCMRRFHASKKMP